MRRFLLLGPVAVALAAVLVEETRGGADRGIVTLLAVTVVMAALDLPVRRWCGERLVVGQPVAALLAIAVGVFAFAGFRPARLLAAIPLVWAVMAAGADAGGRSSRALAPERRRIRAIFRSVALLASLGLVAVAAEALFRARGIYATWTEKNGGRYASPTACELTAPWIYAYRPDSKSTITTPEYAQELVTNGDGVRDVVHPVEKPAGEYRIVAVGDSFTMGQGVEFESTFVRVLGRLLTASGRPGTFRTMSGGVAGSDPVFEVELFLRRFLRYHPDLVLLVVNESDVTDVVNRGGLERFDADGRYVGRPGRWFEPLYARSHAFRALVHNGLGYGMDLLAPREQEPERKAAIGILADAAKRLASESARERCETLVVLHPFKGHLAVPPADDALAPLRGELTSRGVAFVDLYPRFRADAGGDVDAFFWPIDGHCKAKGYELMARGIEAALDEKVKGFPRRPPR